MNIRPLALLALIALLGLAGGELSARGGFSGGGFRMAPSLRSFTPSRSFAPPRLTAPSGSAAPKSLFSWGSRQAPTKSAATQPRLAPSASAAGTTSPSASRSLYDTARSKGTVYSSQSEAVSAFKQKYGSSYGSTFATQPSTRPTWIPSTTTVGGLQYPVVWSPALGGYGYFDSLLGRWILYDALSDAAMAATLLGSQGYWWGAPPVYVSHPSSFVLLSLALFVIFVLLCVIAARRRASRYEPWE